MVTDGLSQPARIRGSACGIAHETLQWGMTSHASGVSRRGLLAGGFGLMALAALPPNARAAARCTVDDWIPSDPFLQDLPRQMQALGVPGIAIAVVNEGELAWSRSFGVTRAEGGAPVDERTLWEACLLYTSRCV